MLIVAIFTLIISLYLLAVICEDFFVSSLDKISDRLKMSSDVAGATLMAVGSSAPELFTALFAVFKNGGGMADVGAGTIVGSAIFNILVIIGAASAFKQAKLTWQPVLRDLLFYIIAILALLFVFRDGQIVLGESILFLLLYGLYVITVTQWKKIFPYRNVDTIEIVEEARAKNKLAKTSRALLALIIPDPKRKPKLYLWTFLISISFIALLSYLLVESAVLIGHSLNINPTIIALTVLAAGTSIPDLFSSVIVAKQGRGDMAVSNAVGSNVFDILISLGLPWFLFFMMGASSIPVSTENLLGSVFLLFATVVAIVVLLIVRKWTIGRRAGLFLIFLYLIYIAYNVAQMV